MKNVLIIEDNPTILRGLKDNFEIKGYKVKIARDGKQIGLSPGEFKMPRLFLKKTGCTLTSDEIRNFVWGYSRFITLRDIDNAVNKLRAKIESDPDNPEFIHTVKMVGYKFILLN
jgi:DNA-binding response OmpR family regulator